MKKYIGVKRIEAGECKRGEFWESAEYPISARKGNANEQGYIVVYPDGYVSWSPKKVFEEAYRECGSMTLGLAIESMKKGYKVARQGWNGKEQYIQLASCISYKDTAGEIVNVKHDAIGNSAIAFCGTSGVQLGWLASQADMLAEDWGIVE